MKIFRPGTIFAGTTLAAGALVAASATAGNYERYGGDFYAYAKVTSVAPVYQTFEHQVPREHCWNERVEVVSHYGRPSATPALVGALVGGALGNELGHHKSNKQVGVVVGALLGSSIGKDIQRRNDYHRTANVNYETRQFCETRYDSKLERQLTGYEVNYRYQGHDYQTLTESHPGDRLRIRVGVTPAE